MDYKIIKREREKAGISQTDFAKMIKVTKQTLYKYEQGIITNIPSNKIEEIANALGLSPAYLMGWDDKKEIENSYPLSDKEYIHITKYRRLDAISKELIAIVIDKELERSSNDYALNDNVVDFGNYKEIPCYPKLASAGTGEYLFDDIPTDTIKIDTREYPKADYAIQVNGDSMEPTFYDGDTLIVERNAVPEKGQIGIFILDNEGYVKRMGNGELISDNKIYPNIIAKYGECMGRVLGKL